VNKGFCAIRPTDGTPIWCTRLSGTFGATPRPSGADGSLYIGDRANRLWALDPNGNKKWFYAIGNAATSTPPAAIGVGRNIYAAGTFNGVWSSRWPQRDPALASADGILGSLLLTGDRPGRHDLHRRRRWAG
jgi:outer membrane protein assembly factor BamB